MRVDAARNRDRILDEARRLIARDGVGVSMDEIAAGASVAVGTLYRHHANKDALIAAVLRHSVEQIAHEAEAAVARVDGGEPAGDALAAVFRFVAERRVEDVPVKEAAASLGVARRAPGREHDDASFAEGSPERRAWDAISHLLAEAQRAERVRQDVGVEDLVALLAGVPGKEASSQVRDRYIDIVLAGLSVSGPLERSAHLPPPSSGRQRSSATTRSRSAGRHADA